MASRLQVMVVSRTVFLALAVIRCLPPSLYGVHLLCADRWAPARFSRYCRRHETVPARLFDSPYVGSRELLERYCRKHAIDAVLPVDLGATLLLASLAPALGAATIMPLSPPAKIRRLADKWEFAELLRAHGVPHPATIRVETAAQLVAAAGDWQQPIFVKPVQGGAGEGAACLRRAADLERYLCARPRWPLVVQEYVPGHDVDMSMLAREGRVLAATIQVVGRDARERVFVDDAGVAAIGRRIVEASAYSGVIHIDMMRDERDGSIKVLEANPRFWITTQYSMWAGLNFPALAVKLARGEHLPVLPGLVVGRCAKPTLQPRELLRLAMRGWLEPLRLDLSPASQRAWRDVHLDPVPQLVARVRGSLQRLWRPAQPAAARIRSLLRESAASPGFRAKTNPTPTGASRADRAVRLAEERERTSVPGG